MKYDIVEEIYYYVNLDICYNDLNEICIVIKVCEYDVLLVGLEDYVDGCLSFDFLDDV